MSDQQQIELARKLIANKYAILGKVSKEEANERKAILAIKEAERKSK